MVVLQLRHLIVSRVGLGIDEHLVLGRFLVLPVENDKLSQNEQVEEDREARSGKPRSVGDEIARLHRDDQDGKHICDVCGSAGCVPFHACCDSLPEMEKKNIASDRPAHRVLLLVSACREKRVSGSARLEACGCDG